MTNQELAQEIIANLGGDENINKVMHCMTRLRFEVKDDSKVNQQAIKDNDKVQGLVISAGQHQVVLGPGFVVKIYDEVLNQLPNKSSEVIDEDLGDGKKKSFFDKFVDIVSGSFMPALGLIAGAGMLQGLCGLLLFMGVIQPDSTTRLIIDGLGKVPLLYLPVILGYTSAKKFGLSPLMGLGLGAALVSPVLTDLAASEPLKVLFEGTVFQLNISGYVFGLPLILPAMGYMQTVLPILAIVAIAAPIERYMKKIMPDAIALFMVPLFTYSLSLLIGLMIVGPVLEVLTNILFVTLSAVLAFNPVVYGMFLGGTWSLLVSVGIHWAIAPLVYIQRAQLGYTTVMVPTAMVCFATFGSMLALYIRVKSKKDRKTILPAMITSAFGISEPALYGSMLKYKRVYMFALITGAIQGGLMMYGGVKQYSASGIGLFQLTGFLNPNSKDQHEFLWAVMVLVITVVISCALPLIFGIGKKEE